MYVPAPPDGSCAPSSGAVPPSESCLTWTQDYPYLEPIIKEIEAERSEREDLESMIIKKKTAVPNPSSNQIESKH